MNDFSNDFHDALQQAAAPAPQPAAPEPVKPLLHKFLKPMPR